MNKHITARNTAVAWQSSTYRNLLTAAETGGRIGVVESTCAPNAGPPRHIHHKEDEIFYVLSGEVTFWLEGEVMTKGPGEAVFIPRGKRHAFMVVSKEAARFLVIVTPGGFENFFQEAAARQLRIPEDMAEVSQLGTIHNIEFVGPPLDRVQ